jgi:hypothetical protein
MKVRLLALVAFLLVLMTGTANAATHYTTPPSHDKFTTQADKDHIVSVVINCVDGSDDASCLNVHFEAYITLVYLWTSNNKSVAEYGCGYGQNHYVDQVNPPPHAPTFTDKNGVTVIYPPKPGALTGRDLARIRLEAFCYGITTDTSLSNDSEADKIFNAEYEGLVYRVHSAVA